MDTDQQLTNPHDCFPSTALKNRKKVHFESDIYVLDQGNQTHAQIQHVLTRSKINGGYLKPEMESEQQIHNKLIFIEDYEHSESSSNGHKSKKNVYSGNKFESLPIFTKQKILLEDSAFEAPELTTESAASSESLDRGSSSNGNLLPLCSVSHFNHSRYDHQKSFSSEEMPENYQYQGLRARCNFAESKYNSDQEEFDDILTVCQHCTQLFDKCKSLQAKNEQISRKNLILNDQLLKYEEIDFQDQQNHQFFEEEKEGSPQHIKELFLFQIEESYKTLLKVNQLIASYDIDFPEKDCQFLEKFWSQFKVIELTVICKEARQQKRRQIQQIHSNYKKTIARLIKKFEQRQSKKEADFKKFMAALSEKHVNEIKHQSLIPAKTERHLKKSKTYAQRQSSTDEDFQRALLQQCKQKVEWLGPNYEHEKEKLNELERHQKEQDQQYIIQINELIKEKKKLKKQVQRYEIQFALFLAKISHQNPQKKQPLSIEDSQFFKNLSQRIFEISNCIPFEQNDEQNLFAPQNEVQLFEMIERIRKFYLKFQSYNKARDSSFQTQRKLLILFMKDFIEQSKISEQKVLEMLQNKKYESLAYIRELIYSSRHKLRRSSTLRESKISRHSLKLQRTHNFMFDSDFPRP